MLRYRTGEGDLFKAAGMRTLYGMAMQADGPVRVGPACAVFDVTTDRKPGCGKLRPDLMKEAGFRADFQDVVYVKALHDPVLQYGMKHLTARSVLSSKTCI